MSKPIAIIGSACRFPGGVDSPSKLWDLLKQPRDVLMEFPRHKLNLWTFYHGNGEHHGSTDVQNKGYLLSEDTRLFDASFFRVSPSEADGMDPQQRLVLETVYEALESAGCTLEQVRGSLTSVYAGLMNADYADIQARDLEVIPTHYGTGTHRSILANRVSYFLDVKGASMTIDTACSSSLVALHQAVQSLRLGESDMAIVVGANLLLDANMYVAESKLHMLSPDSRSRMWDAAANGYARGEGFAAIVLKRLEEAIKDGYEIECVVRGSAVNSDGRTAGITVPNAEAQTMLIRQAYRDAGLDPLLDRCQFFEAHGTGTRAGDPVEANAIRDAFFPEGQTQPGGKLFVGSIKTVVGHLEGCAGLAGVLKASLAMQNRTIPPNMHFSNLNPAIVPFYDRLEIPTEASEWPEVFQGSPLRVSVNSFGFGGTNAHVVLESFHDGFKQLQPQQKQQNDDEENVPDERFIGPLVFSANSRASLVQSIKVHTDHIRNNPHLNLAHLAWTLQLRRTHFGNSRAFFSGATRQKLVSYMDVFVDANSNSSSSPLPVDGHHCLLASDNSGPAILGIFTGQGAQWPSMGRNLMLHSPLFRKSMADCEASLAALGPDAPSWSLTHELLAQGDCSRIDEAAISQPLCTAIQIGLVDVLRAAGVTFASVVGHSSGEIAAVYAVGIISAFDAIRIAYYRGLHARLARGPNGQSGSMLAVGLSLERATEVCANPEYAGRVTVAAANSPTSVTLSGDEDAIDELKAQLDADKTFARKLKVDTAYHSHHMEPCASAYLASLRSCNIQVQRPHNVNLAIWVSSVHGNADILLDDEYDAGLDALKDQYWLDNLLSPVLFAPALETALWRAGPFDVASEVGPHPALKGPSTQVFKASLGYSLPYFSVMRRGDDEIEALSGGLGYLWEHFGSVARIDFEGYCQAFLDANEKGLSAAPRLVKGLPSYCWDHSRVHWKESRISHNFRLGDRPIHEMLGRRTTDDSSEWLRWRNILRISEFPWVRHHEFQGQTVLPGAAYVAAVVEVVKVLARGKTIKLVELLDLKIPRAVVLQENKSTELVTTVRLVGGNDSFLSAEFVFSAASADDATSVLERTCSGRVEVHIGKEDGEDNGSDQLLPIVGQPSTQLTTVDLELFYTTLRQMGINYQGLFRASKSAQRTMGYARTRASWDAADLGESYSLHPAILDVGFHAVLAAFASPSTGQMWTMYLPVGIRRVTINLDSLPQLQGLRGASQDISAEIVAQVTRSSVKGLESDVQIMFGGRVGVQVEGVELQAAGSAGSDRVLFSNTRWDSDISTGVDRVVVEHPSDPVADDELLEALGRTSLYYYRILLDDISPREAKSLAWHHQMFWQSAQHWVDEVSSGRHPSVKREWLDDTREAVWKQAEKYQNTIDLAITRTLGERLVSIARGETQPLEVMMENDMLNRFYKESYGLDGQNDHIARAVAQITHRHPRANILEIGGGVGATTRKVLGSVRDAFSHYTFTDISSGFFEKAAEKFTEYRRKMTFKVCDIEKDPVEQGFAEGTYDVIVAANVLHATRCLVETMRNVRRLLKPGGYLVMMEITGDMMRLGFIMGPLPGWWLGPRLGDEGRRWSPGISTVHWDDLLQRTGFSGVDYAARDHAEPSKHYVSTLVSQAVNDKVDTLRTPLSNLGLIPPLPHKLIILGGESLLVARLARHLKKMLAPWGTPIDHVTNLAQLSLGHDERVSVISLTELDQPLFAKSMTSERLKSLQMLLSACDSVLWTTCGCRGASPTSNMFVGIARALRTERSEINLQLLDVEKPLDASASLLAGQFLRLVLGKQQHQGDADESMLWTTEPELACAGDILLIPRLVPDVARNERYNASRRTIRKDVTLKTAEIEIDTGGSVVSLLGVEYNLSRRLLAGYRTSEHVMVDVYLSVALPYHPPHPQYFLCYGSVQSTHQKAFALSRTNRSVIASNPHDTLQLESPPPPGLEAPTLEALAGQLVACSLAFNLDRQRRGPVVVYEPPSQSLVKAIESSSLWKDRQVYFAGSRNHGNVATNWISINPRALSSSLRQKFQVDVAFAFDFSAPGTRDIRDFVPADSVATPRLEPFLLGREDGQHWDGAYADALAAVGQTIETQTKTVPIGRLPGSPLSTIEYPVVIDWDLVEDEVVTVHLKPLQPAGIFSSPKTHLMVGLNGDLGQSICGYMIRNGAHHLAICSRRAEVDSNWLQMMRRDYGADVRLYKMDVSSRKSICSTLDQIRAEMPPIGGVSNGALVLADKTFLNMDIESLNETLKPKVDGSRYLDELFPTPDLDYFVLFSSLATVGNNAGQGNYHAANMFMTSLVSQRRAKGLAGSVIHVGVVVDAGYVARQDDKGKLVEHLRKQGFLPTSETDAHFLFSEGVLASPADPQLAADICMGFEPYQDSAQALCRPQWYDDPRLSHFIVQPAADDDSMADSTGGMGGDTAAHIRQKLDEAASAREAHLLLQEAFSAKLESMMQLDAGSVNVDVPLLDLGFDSLLAVETRTWFLKEIHVDVPVLRFLGGDTAHEICMDAAAQYLTMRAGRDAKEKDEKDEAAVKEPSHPFHPGSSESHVEGKENDEGLTSSSATTSEGGQPPSSSMTASPSLEAPMGVESVPTPLTTISSPARSALDVQEKRTQENGIQTKGIHQTQKPTVRETSRTELMSYSESRLWFLDQYLDDPTTCNIVVSYLVTGPLDVDRLRGALDMVIAHHASLRTCFYADKETGEPMQGLLRKGNSNNSTTSSPSRLQFRHGPRHEDVQREFDALRNHVWDLAEGDTFAATLLSTETQDRHILIFGYHHIVIDGVSWHVMLRDLERAYTGLPLSRQRKLYMDASVEQREAVETGVLNKEISFWKTVHATPPQVLPLLPMTSARRRQPLRRYDMHTVTKDLGLELVGRIKDASRSLRVTPFQFYLAAVQALFAKLLDIQELCIGVTDASRTDAEFVDTVGFFLNMLPLRFKLHRDDTFADLVRETSKHVLEGRQNGRVPIDVLLDRLNVPRDPSSNPLFQVTFNYRVGSMAELRLGDDCRLSVEAIRDAQGPFDLGFGIYEMGDGSCVLQLLAQSCLYDNDAAESVRDAYVNLLNVLSHDTSRMIRQYNMADAAAVQKGLSVGKGPRTTWDWPDTLSKRVNSIIAQNSNSVAIIETYGTVSYGELEGRIFSVASTIQQHEPTKGSRIAVLCQPSAQVIVCMLAILRLGLVYVPLDTNLPRERHAAILADCQPAMLLCHQQTLETALSLTTDTGTEFPPFPPVINLSPSSSPGWRATDTNEPQDDVSDPASPAFLLYTSGSTGRPKGILLNQAGILNHLALKTFMLSLNREVVLQQSSYGFDMSLTQTFCALANGGSLVIVPRESRGDPLALAKLMLEHSVTLTLATPSEYAMLLRNGQSWLRKCKSWTQACMGGEAVTQQLVQIFQELGNTKLQLTNCYGPTESSLAMSFDMMALSPAGELPRVHHASVGKVLPNYSVYIVDETTSQPVPLGFPGEICVGGAGVALYYLNLPELSASKFPDDPFADADDVARGWTRMFKTGDRGRLRADGSLVFMGRIEGDSMIKLRGLRIDLDDVANTIVQAAGDAVAEAAVTVRGDDDEAQMLVAHVVPQPGSTLDGVEQWQQLVRALPLPVYMRPSLVVAVHHLPHTSNGKVDRRAIKALELPALECNRKSQGARDKLSLQEGELSLLWEEVLGSCSTISRTDWTPESDFFMVGGSSLLLMQLQGAIREKLGLAVPIAELYQGSTLGRMAAHLHAVKGQHAPPEDIDWERETDLHVSSSGLDTTTTTPPSRLLPESNREILLTGAHDFLGAHVLEELVRDSSVKRVHCVALPRAASKTMAPSSKVALYPGSLQSESLGLSSDDISFLQSRIHLIIHAGSIGHCLNNFSSLRGPNLESLRFLVHLALQCCTPIHFVSSSRVTLLSGCQSLPPVSVAPYQPPKDGSEGFTASKWAGERLLEKVAQTTGLEVTIHRPCAVAGSNAPNEDALNALLRYTESRGAVPRFSNLVGFLDFAPVADVARNIARLALKRNHDDDMRSAKVLVNAAPTGDTDTRPTIVHHSSGVKTSISDFRRRMEVLHRRDFGELDVADWIAEAVNDGMDPLISTYLEALVEKQEMIAFPYLGQLL